MFVYKLYFENLSLNILLQNQSWQKAYDSGLSFCSGETGKLNRIDLIRRI